MCVYACASSVGAREWVLPNYLLSLPYFSTTDHVCRPTLPPIHPSTHPPGQPANLTQGHFSCTTSASMRAHQTRHQPWDSNRAHDLTPAERVVHHCSFLASPETDETSDDKTSSATLQRPSLGSLGGRLSSAQHHHADVRALGWAGRRPL